MADGEPGGSRRLPLRAVAPIVERGVGVPLKVRIGSRTTNAAIAGADIRDAYVDRSPEGQAGGVLPAFFTPSLEYGVSNFRAAYRPTGPGL
ncbi:MULTISPECIES: hypothetical protein [Phenylobacterium]|uniref:Uncharacterized protein n=1 Tax=Phenylobacterium haematophilum TaxID=98513 RepID=A0A840A6H3_9CAUL|nr:MULTISPECIES: hypothetical protein [Phenylobacterium]MBB3892807.1 hypothetical protein [Phenylobacterium haematophilum]